MPELEVFFLALADRTRLRLLNLLSDCDVCVFDFTTVLQEPQPKISRHLAFLRRAKIVETARHGKWIYYRLASKQNKNAKRILHEVLSCLAEDKQMLLDKKRFHENVKNTDQAFSAQSLNSNAFKNVDGSDDETDSKFTDQDKLPVFLL